MRTVGPAMKLLLLGGLINLLSSIDVAGQVPGQSPLGAETSILKDENFFPIGVWLQDPRNADKFKAAGINLFVGLWRGPTTDQLNTLKEAGMPVICAQNSVGLMNKDNPIIAAWMHGDEPDNAQSLGAGKGYGPPIKPEVIQRDYQRIRANDSSRPIFLNLGQGVAWDNYIGRGVRRNHPEDYAEYIKGGDIVSFDIYPVVHDHAEISGKLEFVARGVERLRKWSGPEKTVWNCIECTHISNPEKKATPDQIRAEIWMALIHGSRGIVYFVHQFKPSFKEAALLDDPETLAGVTRINSEIKSLARVLNSPSAPPDRVIVGSDSNLPVATMMKRVEGTTYLFAVGMANQAGTVSFKFVDRPESDSIEAMGESRRIPLTNGEFKDEFKPYGVHLYRVLK